MSSLSIDSSRSPNGNSARQSTSDSIHSAGEQLRNNLSTPQRSSRELSRETSNASAGSRASHRFSIHSPGSPASSGIDSPLNESRPGSTNSPLERRFSRRIATTRRASGSGLATEAVPEGVEYSTHQRQDSMASVDERIREAEEKLARRASLRAARAASEQQASPSPTKTPFKRFSSQRSNLSTLAGESPTGAQSPSWMESPREPPSPTRQQSWEAGDDGANGDHRTHTRADSRANGNGDPRLGGDRGGDRKDKTNTPTSGSRSGGKSRGAIPAEFQNGRLVSSQSVCADANHPSLHRHLMCAEAGAAWLISTTHQGRGHRCARRDVRPLLTASRSTTRAHTRLRERKVFSTTRGWYNGLAPRRARRLHRGTQGLHHGKSLRRTRRSSSTAGATIYLELAQKVSWRRRMSTTDTLAASTTLPTV